MAEVKCPMCSKPNPEELEVCQFCEARLKPLTDELSRSQPPIHPGEEPTEQDTGQLEPILPQWLQEVRQQARDSVEVEADESAEQAPAEEETPQPKEPADLLAGLQSQSDEDEDEIPDWLAGLRGEKEAVPGEKTSTDKDDQSALQRMLGEEAPASRESEDNPLPGWISDLDAEETGTMDMGEPSAFPTSDVIEKPAQAESQPKASDSDFKWAADFESESETQSDSGDDDISFDTDLPAWLQGAEESPKDDSESLPPFGVDAEEPAIVLEGDDVTPPASDGELPDWLATLSDEDLAESPQQEAEQPEAQGEPDWISSLGEGTVEASHQEVPQPDTEGEVPDWVSSLGDESSEEVFQQAVEGTTAADGMPEWAASTQNEIAESGPEQEVAQPAADDELPDWVSSLGAEESDDAIQPAAQEPPAVGDLPDWASSADEKSDKAAPLEEPQAAFEGDLPDWLSSLGDEGTSLEGEEISPPVESGETAQSAAEEETPDLLSSMSAGAIEDEQPFEPIEAPVAETDVPVVESEMTSPFVDDEGKPISAEDVESIFSMDMPDWLSDAEGVGEKDLATPAVGATGGDLDLAELPSWVQAMRPVESVISETGVESAEEQPMEEQGPLAGLRGVLPAVPGVGPSSAPKTISIKLEASDEQQANAAMLEQMLAEEEYPRPVSAQKVVYTQRLLRWVIAFLVLLVVGGTIFSGTQINQMPTSAPLETSAALTYIQNTLPTDAPVLLIFDYEASLAGELEATSAPLVDHMLTLKHPRLSFIASTPTGSGLAERFMKNTQGSHNYERNQQFVNLGYLPGGAAGVLAFSADPRSTKPLSTTGENAWTTQVLASVENLTNFAAIILLTDDIETARIWIEQTENARGEARFLVVSSARSGPMIQPYYESGQVDGLITGLDGSAPIEQVNSGRPGMVRRYWDAYGFGLLTAVGLIALGSLWSLFSAWRASRKEQGGE